MLQDGYFDNIYYRFWKSAQEKDVIANIFAIHGLGGHCIWFDSAAENFNKKNVNFFSFDLPAFGQSKYPKGTISSYKVWIEVSKVMLRKFLVQFEIKSPVFVLGHSMGALVALLLAKEVKVNGWIISVPGFEGHKQSWPLFSFLIPTLFKSVFIPQENIILPFGPELLTKNKETQLRVKQDSLRVVNVGANIFLHVFFLTLVAKTSYKYLDAPVLVLTAGNDMVCSSSAMEDFFKKIKFNDKSKKTYTNSFHDLFIEDELPQVVSDITEWIKIHLAR